MVLTKYQGERIAHPLERKLEDWLGLIINRKKGKVVNLPGAKSLDFLVSMGCGEDWACRAARQPFAWASIPSLIAAQEGARGFRIDCKRLMGAIDSSPAFSTKVRCAQTPNHLRVELLAP